MKRESIMDFRETGRILVRDAGFIYLLPHPALQKWIANYTITFPHKGMMSDQYAVIPHGCATLVFACDDRGTIAQLFGPMKKPARVGREANAYGLLFIVEFQPAGYYAFSGMLQKELTDWVLPLGDANPALDRLIARHLETAVSVEGFIAEVDRLFLAHLKTAFYQQEFSLANQMIVDSGGRLSVKEISQTVFYSERHLGRIFDRYMGVNVKAFSRLVRVNKALRLLRRPGNSIMQVCLQTGYYDMPHFIHDFKAICGITPQEYRAHMSDFYSEIAKFKATMEKNETGVRICNTREH